MSTIALFDPSRSRIDSGGSPWSRLPFDSNDASTFRGGAQQLLAQRMADRRLFKLEANFIRDCLRPMAVELSKPAKKGDPKRYPNGLDFRPSTRTLIRALALLAADTYDRETDASHELSSRLIEVLARLPAGSGNTQDDAANAERVWLRDHAVVLSKMLQIGGETEFRSIPDMVTHPDGTDALGAFYRTVTAGLKSWLNDANEELIRSWNLPPTAVFETTLPGSAVIEGSRYALEVGGPAYIVAAPEDGKSRVYLEFPATLADDSRAPRFALLGTIDRRGFTPEPKNAQLARAPRVAANLNDLAGAINEVPVKSLDIPLGAEERAMGERGRGGFDLDRDYFPPEGASTGPRLADTQGQETPGGLILRFLNEPQAGAPKTERPSAPSPAPEDAPPEGKPTVVLPPTERQHRLKMREVRVALAMSPKAFLEAVTVAAPTFSDPTEYAAAVMEWEQIPGELNSLELVVLASGLGLPAEFLVAFLDGEILLSGLLKRRKEPKRHAAITSPRGPGDW